MILGFIFNYVVFLCFFLGGGIILIDGLISAIVLSVLLRNTDADYPFGVYSSIIAIYENKIINHVSGNSILQDLENILVCLDRNKSILKTNIIQSHYKVSTESWLRIY